MKPRCKPVFGKSRRVSPKKGIIESLIVAIPIEPVYPIITA